MMWLVSGIDPEEKTHNHLNVQVLNTIMLSIQSTSPGID